MGDARKVYTSTCADLFSTDSRGYRAYDKSPDPEPPGDGWRLVTAVVCEGVVHWYWESEATNG